MAIGSIYRKYFKNNLFLKLILLFSLITIATIITFSYLMYRTAAQSAVRRELDNQARAMESVNRYISGKYESVRAMMNDVYRSDTLSANLSYFLLHSYDSYVKYQLDHYSAGNGGEFASVTEYFFNRLDSDADIRNIVLYSSEKQVLYAFDANKRFKLVPTNAARSYIPDVMAMETRNVTAPNVWVSKAIGQSDPRVYTVRVPVNDKQTLKNIGQLLVYFDSERISNALAGYKTDLKGTIVVRDANGNVFYDSAGTRYGQKLEIVDGEPAALDGRQLANGVYTNRLSSGEGGYAVIGEATREEIAASYKGTRNTIVLICLICIAVATLIPSLFIMSFARRTNEIIRFTRRIKNGDLKARIVDTHEDELGQISRSFNAMLDELNQYIDRVYKAEIKQKHAELAALQARVNPHFLYNTLEVIRMRAFSQGDNDAAEMIYSLSMLFKNLVKQNREYTLHHELEACRLYLEMFRIRYKNKFAYEVECPPELRSAAVMRLSLQPIVENYIVHGMDPARTDNRLSVRVMADGGDIRAVIEDNGKGIEASRLAELKALLKSAEESEGFGLRSVHARLNLVYGEPYGLDIESEPGAGTTVTIRLPASVGEAKENA